MPNTNTIDPADLEIIIHSKILQDISRQLRRPSLDTNIIGVLDKYMKIWENCDNFLANGVIDQNLNFAEASIVLQECARVYSKKVKILWNMVNDFHGVLCNLIGDNKPTNVKICNKPKQSTKKQPETNTTAPEPDTNNAVESKRRVLDKRKEGNNSNENIQTETNVEEEEDDDDDDDDEYDDVYNEDDCFIVEDENEVPQLKFLKYNTRLDDMGTGSITRKTLTKVWTPIPLCKRRYDPIVYIPNVIDPNDEFLNFAYNTNVPINEHPLYNSKEKMIDISKPLFFTYTVPVFYKMRETDDFVIYKTEKDDTVSLIENLNIKKGLENMVFNDVKVKLIPLTEKEILKYTKKDVKQCGIISEESNHDFNDHFDDTDERSLNNEICEDHINNNQTIKEKSSKKAKEIRKRRLGIEERNFEPKPAKLFKPFSVSFDNYENFYYDNYSLDANEGVKDVPPSNHENQNNSSLISTKSMDSGRYSMGLPAEDDNQNCSGCDSGIGLTLDSVPRDNNETYLENLFPDISFDPETIDMYKNLVGDDTEEKRMKENYEEWEARINEVTAGAEEKSDFDIHVYEDKILNSFSEDNNKVQFSSVIADKSASEISRFLIATLQLANTYNVEIINHKPGEINNNTMELKFLSNARYHETLNEYHAPSEEMFNEKFAAIKQNCTFMHSTPITLKHATTSAINLSRQNIKRRKLSLN